MIIKSFNFCTLLAVAWILFFNIIFFFSGSCSFSSYKNLLSSFPLSIFTGLYIKLENSSRFKYSLPKKIEEIRQAIRRRYGNRKNIYKVFQLWAKTFPNKITVYDAYKMINSLSIPINYNETKVFIASGSFFGN